MVARARKWMVTVALAALVAGTGYSQTPSPPPPATPPLVAGTPAPEVVVPALPAGPSTVSPAALGRPQPCPSCGGSVATQRFATPAFGPPSCAPYEDYNGPLLKGNPLLDEPCYAPPGWFAAVEADVVGPHVKNEVTSANPILAGGTLIHLPGAPLDWTGALRLDVGYRLAQGSGEFLLSYRNLVASGSDTLLGFDARGNAGALHSRLNVNAVDLDYGGREYSLLPHWDMKWLAGFRLANVFFDSRAGSPLLQEATSNYYYGAGPHLRLDLWRHVEDTGLSFFARLDTAYLLFGEDSQSFTQMVTNPDGTVTGGALRENHNQPVPVLGVQAGLDWRLPSNPHLSFAAGYLFERWFVVADEQASHGDVTIQGVFLRGEYSY